MFEILTLPEWEIPMPAEYRFQDETFWSCVELPISQAWVFLLNLDEGPDGHVPRRSIAVTSGSALLSTIARIGEQQVRSVYLISRSSDDEMSLDRILSIDVGIDPDVRGRKVIQMHMESGNSLCSPNKEVAGRTTMRTLLKLCETSSST